VQINPKTAAKDLVKMLKETGTKVSISTVKQVVYQHNLKGRSARKNTLLQILHKKDGPRFATAHGDSIVLFGQMSSDLMKQTYNCLAIMTIVMFGGKRQADSMQYSTLGHSAQNSLNSSLMLHQR
jgi:hypothetical protein